MRYALIADVHANLPALEAVLEDIAERAPGSAVYHLGDLVGYAPWPNETIELLRERGIAGVSGNYDSTVAAEYEHCGCKYEDPVQEELAHRSYEWTRRHLRADLKAYLGRLPFRIDLQVTGGHLPGPRLILVHGTPTLNTVYWTQDRSDAFCLRMARAAGASAGDVIAFGHTHKPWYREIGGVHLVNCGSTGRPKDGDWRACYVLLDIAPGAPVHVRVVRCVYDLAGAVEQIRQSDLPNAFATMLETGGTLPESARHDP